jgi:hypothetical protein
MKLSETLHGVGRPIAYLPGVAKFLGGVKAGLLFCQLFYWSERTESGWFWKSQEELADETGLTIDELRAARKELTEKGVLQSHYKRIEHRLYFKIDRQRLDELWVTRNGQAGSPQMADRKIPDGDVVKSDLDRSDPETTTETTQIPERNGRHLSVVPKKTESETETVTPEDLIEAWNEYCAPLGLPAVTELSRKRRKKALARIREHPLPSWWEVVFERISQSPFLKGQIKPSASFERPFQAKFDWLLEEDNALKVFEGQIGG